MNDATEEAIQIKNQLDRPEIFCSGDQLIFKIDSYGVKSSCKMNPGKNDQLDMSEKEVIFTVENLI